MFQLISHHSTNGDVHRLSIGFTTCKLAGGASNWQAWWLAAYCWGIADSDRLQKICPDVRMSFHGLMVALEWILDDISFFSFQPLLERCLIRKHAFITGFRIQAEARAPKFPGACCDSPQVRVGSWNQHFDGVGRVSGICHEDADDVTLYLQIHGNHLNILRRKK